MVLELRCPSWACILGTAECPQAWLMVAFDSSLKYTKFYNTHTCHSLVPAPAVGFPVLLREFKQTKAPVWALRARRGSDHFGGGGKGTSLQIQLHSELWPL